MDHRGLVLNSHTGALAVLGLARWYAVLGDKARAHVTASRSCACGRTPIPILLSSNEQRPNAKLS